MKKLLLLLTYSIISLNAFAQCDWWAKSFSGTGNRNLQTMTTDASGNIYITGSFTGTFMMGSVTLISEGDRDIFLAKVSEAGDVIWAKRAGGLYQDEGSAIAIDNSGNIYIGGTFYISATFESTTLDAGSGARAFLARYDNNGNLSWVHETEGARVPSIAVSGTSIYYLSSSSSSSNSSSPAFHEFSTSGNYVGITNLNASEYNHWGALPSIIKVDNNGNIFIGGTFYSTYDFGSGDVSVIGSNDIFLVKYTSSKVFSFVKTGGGSGYENMYDLAINNTGDVVITIGFDNSVTFNNTSISSPRGSGRGLIKYSNSGDLLWAKLSGSGWGFTSVAFDNSGNIYHYTSKHYEDNEFGGIVLNGNGHSVLAKYTTAGSLLDAVLVNGSGSGSRLIKVNSNNKIIIGENFYGNIVYGSIQIQNSSSQNFALVKIDQLSDLIFKEPSICSVEIDQATGKNKIIWDKEGMANVDYFSIYRMNKIGEFENLGNVAFNSTSVFVDNTSEPVEREYYYKLSLTDICGVEYEKPYEEIYKTIHLQLFQGPANRWSLSWGSYFNPYMYYDEYENTYYRIYRGTTANNMVPIDSIAFSTTYTDINAPSGDLFYKVEAVFPDRECGNSSSSNRVSNTNTLTNIWNTTDAELFSIYPNPASVEFNILIGNREADLSILNALGQEVLQEKLAGGEQSINIGSLKPGIYKVIVKEPTGIIGIKSLVTY